MDIGIITGGVLRIEGLYEGKIKLIKSIKEAMEGRGDIGKTRNTKSIK